MKKARTRTVSASAVPSTKKASRPALPADLKACQKDRRGDFVRLAKGRSSAALKQIQLIGNLSVKAQYEYSKEDVDKIFSAIENEIAATKARFHASMTRGSAAVDFG